ncbi:MAG TPA: YceI family protein [Cyclobacteriaceae bacterium]|jgi:hypothetical protein
MGYYLILLGGILWLIPNPAEKERWLVQRSSNLTIEGKSNISDFSCEIEGTNITDTLTINYDDDGGQITFVRKQIKINTVSADCGNNLITKDFRETLKSDKHPDIFLNFLTLERPQLHDFSALKVNGTIEIIIAAVARKYEVTYQIIPHTTGKIELIGSQKMRLGDFKLQPPSRLLGLLKVEEEITVDFHLQLTPIL